MSSFDPASTYVCFSPSGGASTMEVTPELWATIDERDDLKTGRLVAVFASDADWPHWEMHPHGEEVLVLLSGRMTMVFEERDHERSVELQEGRSCIVPRGTWHRATFAHSSRDLLPMLKGRGARCARAFGGGLLASTRQAANPVMATGLLRVPSLSVTRTPTRPSRCSTARLLSQGDPRLQRADGQSVPALALRTPARPLR